jgi:hypothetical protein
MLDHVPARLRIIRTCRPRYGCRACGTIRQALRAANPVGARRAIQLNTVPGEDLALPVNRPFYCGYALTRWTALCRVIDDGRVDLDNNTVEPAIRQLGRKNRLFAGSNGGAERWTVVGSLLATAKLNGDEPLRKRQRGTVA